MAPEGCAGRRLQQRVYYTWAALAARGITPLNLPDFPFRDDAGLVWDAIHTCVREAFNAFYPSDAAVAGDDEIQKWHTEISGANAGSIQSIPPLDCKATLISFITEGIFKAGPLHNAMNAGQLDAYGYSCRTATIRAGRSAGPGRSPVPHRVPSPASPNGRTCRACITPGLRLQETLKGVSKTVRERNRLRLTPYEYMDPATMAFQVSL